MTEEAAPTAGEAPLPAMTRYVVGLLRRAPAAPPISDEERARVQTGHLAHLLGLLERGELVSCGPFEEETDLRGLMVFRTSSVDRARELMRDDPAIVRGRLVLDVLTWYAPAGLALVPEGPRPPGPSLTFETD